MFLWEQQDAAQLLRNRLRRAMPQQEKQIRAEVEEKWTPRDGPVIAVVADGTPISGRGHTTEQVRILVRADSLPKARRILQGIDGFLTAPANRVLGMGIKPGAGLIAGPDSKMGGYYAAATYSITTPRKVNQNDAFA